MSALGKEIASKVLTASFGFQIPIGSDEIATADAAIAPLVALLERSRDREHNPFEPSNQSELYDDLCAILALAGGPQAPRPTLGQHIAEGCGDD